MLASLWHKIKVPIINQLKQGVTPHKLAQSISFGATIGLFPILGTTTSLCLLLTAILKLNHVAIQTINYIVYPLQIILIIPYIRLGEFLFQAEHASLNILTITKEFEHHPWDTVNQYATSAILGIVAWILCAPLIYFSLYFISKKILSTKLAKMLTP